MPVFNSIAQHARAQFTARVVSVTGTRVRMVGPDGRRFQVPMAEFVQYWTVR